jgi:molybdopterin-guanine dinucleotide biosynthesis protein A
VTRLGVILAGGQSTRFGQDKALVRHDGRLLFDHARDGLAPFVDALAVAGRDWPAMVRIDDAPRPGLGPLGGLAGALRYAAAHGFDEVLTTGCDTLGLRADHIAALQPGPAVLDALPIIGCWPARLAPVLHDWLDREDRHSVYGFAAFVGARHVAVAQPPRNINRPEDLAAPAPY